MIDSIHSFRSTQACVAFALLAFGSGVTHAQQAGSSSFTGAAATPPLSSAPAPTASNPDPAGPSSQPLALPRNYRIAPAATGSDTPAKFSYYLGSTGSVRNFFDAFFIAGFPNLTAVPSRPPYDSYGSAWDTYENEMTVWGDRNEPTLRYHARRLEVGFATAETRQLASNLALPLLFHQQPWYVPAPIDATFGQRMTNAAESIVVTRSDSGLLVPNYSKLGGTVLAGFLGEGFYANTMGAPELATTHFAMKYIGYSLLADLATNTTHELIRAARAPEMEMYSLHGRATEDSYYPLSFGGKAIYWLHSTYSPRNFLTAGLIASVIAVPSEPKQPERYNSSTWHGYPDYGDAYQAWSTSMFTWKDDLEDKARQFGRRFGGGLSEVESQQFLQNFAIPVAFDMDPRYIPLGPGYTAGQRMEHSFTSLVIGHTDSGNPTINLPLLGGTVGAAFAAKELYYSQLGAPELATNSLLVRTISLNLVADGAINLLSEFFGHRSY